MLPTRPAETHERIRRNVIPPRNRDLLDGIRNALNRDRQKPARNLTRLASHTRRALNLRSQYSELVRDDARIELLVPVRPEYSPEEIGLHLPDHHIAIRHSEWPAASIARRPRICPRRLRPHTKARSIETANRSATGRDRMDVHHRRTQANARDDTFKAPL